ncbi:unnamed protein product [Urochloa humidicola]
MDPLTSYNLEIRIFCNNSRTRWFSYDMPVDSDTTNFKDLVDEMVDKYPCSYGDVVKLFYYCADTKTNIQVHSDQDLVDMFAKNVSSKICLMSIAYHSPTEKPPVIPLWYEYDEVPCTPSVPVPCQVEPSQATHSDSQTCTDTQPEDNFLLNPEPENEHVGVDEEGMYIDVEGNQQFNVGPLVGHDEKVDEALDESDSEDDSDSDSDYDEDEGDGMVQDNVPPSNPEVVYGKDDPPMIVGSTYPNMAAFKLALASHAIRHEFEYNIEKSDPGRYMVYCAGRIDGCRWRIHASTMDDQVTVKVIIHT